MNKKSLNWIIYISNRFNKVDRKGHSSVTSKLASLGICFGVMSLIVVMSVMNGFQMGFIKALMEISSFHIQLSSNENTDYDQEIYDWCSKQNNILSVTPFYEAQGLMAGKTGEQSAVLLRAVPKNIIEYDKGFADELKIISGDFNLNEPNGIIIGSTIAKNLNVRVGSKVNLFALSGSSDVSLFSQDRNFVVRGIFFSDYAEINASYCFINLDDGQKYLGKDCIRTYGIKIKESNREHLLVNKLKKSFPSFTVKSWRDYNRSFFGALRIEKNILMLLVLLIFIVVGVNIYNGMKRIVYERKEDIAVLSALGGKRRDILNIFVIKGFLTGFYGAVPGLIIGIFLCLHIGTIFILLSKIQYYVQYFFALIFTPESALYVQENAMFSVYASIPAVMMPKEILFIVFFGIFSSLIASYLASRDLLKLSVSEVLRDE